MKQAKLWTMNFVMVMISNFAAAFSHACFATVMALYINDIGGTNRIAGLVAGGMTMMMVVATPILGNMLDRFGRRPMVIWGGILFALNTVVYNFIHSLPLLIVVRIVHGLSQAMYCIATSTLVADIVPEERLTTGLGLFGVSGSLSGVLGPIVGLTIYQNLGASFLFAFMTVFACMGSVAAFLIRLPEDHKMEQTSPAGSFAERLRAVPKAVIGLVEVTALLPGLIALFNAFGYSSVQNFLTVCGQARGIGNVSVYFTVCSCAIIATRLLAGRIAKILRDATVVLMSLVMIGLSLVTIAFSYQLGMLIVAGVLYGLGMGMLEPVLQTLVFTLCGPDRRGSANATYRLLRDVGTGIGAAAWGAVTMGAGYTVTYLLSAGCLALAVAVHLLVLRPRMRKTV